MTNHQDKELSSDLIEQMLLACVPGGSIVDPQRVADNIRAWFAQLPVAEQPAGQAPYDARLDVIKTAYATGYDKFTRQDIAYLLDKVNSPHSPVAQMSGDEPTYAELQSLYAGQCQLTDEIAAKLAAGSDAALTARISELEADLATMNKRYSDLQASHPSNAVQEMALCRELIEPYSHGLIGAPLPETVFEAMQELLDHWIATKDAATVPQVVQAPEGWKLVPIEPTNEMMQAGFDVQGSHLYGLTYRAMVRIAPQPVAAPIVPSDEQIIALANESDMPAIATVDNPESLLSFARALLTTASNAGEAAPAAIDVRDAYALGWMHCARWAFRADLIADIDSPIYLRDRDAALQSPPQSGNAGEAVKGGEA